MLVLSRSSWPFLIDCYFIQAKVESWHLNPVLQQERTVAQWKIHDLHMEVFRLSTHPVKGSQVTWENPSLSWSTIVNQCT